MTDLAIPVLAAPAADPVPGCVLVEPGPGGVATLRLGAPSETLVTFTVERMASLESALAALERDRDLRALIVTGPGPDMFTAGADVGAIAAVTDAAAGEAAARAGAATFARLAQLRVPVVAAIDGPCLGAGLELALACARRLCSDAASTRLGLPEVRLGIVPGFGGTQRLPRLIGLPAAVDLILSGRLLGAKEARRLGLVDRVVPAERLLAAARAEAAALLGTAPRRRRWPLTTRLLSHTGIGRALVRQRAERRIEEGPGHSLPAPRRALELCAAALSRPAAAGAAAEARALGELIVTPESRALVRMFFLSRQAQRSDGRSPRTTSAAESCGRRGDEAHERPGKADAGWSIDRVCMLGAGAMGAGIAAALAQAGVRVRLGDVQGRPLASAKARLQRALDAAVRRGRQAPAAAQAAADRLAVALNDGASLARCQLFLEAVVEDLDVKRAAFASAIDRGLPADAILASNTSSLSIDALAAGVPAPARVVGLHFFNPPEKMPLVEVVRGAHTDPAVVATACRLVTRLGKFPLVVRDGPGFFVNRCLAPYLDQAAALLLEGHAPEAIDSAVVEFGMPMGPCRLLDEIGFDVALKVSATLQAAFPDRLRGGPLPAAMVAAGALGTKSGGGLYGTGGRGPGPGRAVLAGLRSSRRPPPIDADELRARLIYPMVDEAFRCLAAGVVAGTDELDFGLVFGIGFPAARDGVTGFVRAHGAKRIVDRLDSLARSLDPRLAPSDALRQRALS